MRVAIYRPSDLRRLKKLLRGYAPGWWSTGGGGGGGLSSVTTDATLTGNGTAGSPLKVAAPFPSGWPLAWWNTPPCGSNAAGTFTATANKLTLYGLFIPAQVQFGHIVLDISVADAVNSYDFGLYNNAGTLVAHIGAQTIPATGIQSFAVVGGPITINPGRYYVAGTGNANTASLQVGNMLHVTWNFLLATNFGASAGGALPASIAPPADSIQTQYAANFVLMT
jgi:hypothetical protein